jgi:hypothetical protein
LALSPRPSLHATCGRGYTEGALSTTVEIYAACGTGTADVVLTALVFNGQEVVATARLDDVPFTPGVALTFGAWTPVAPITADHPVSCGDGEDGGASISTPIAASSASRGIAVVRLVADELLGGMTVLAVAGCGAD